MELTRLEKLSLEALVLRQQQIQRDYIDPITVELKFIFATIEERLGLPAGSVGTQYTPNYLTGELTNAETNTTE